MTAVKKVISVTLAAVLIFEAIPPSAAANMGTVPLSAGTVPAVQTAFQQQALSPAVELAHRVVFGRRAPGFQACLKRTLEFWSRNSFITPLLSYRGAIQLRAPYLSPDKSPIHRFLYVCAELIAKGEFFGVTIALYALTGSLEDIARREPPYDDAARGEAINRLTSTYLGKHAVLAHPQPITVEDLRALLKDAAVLLEIALTRGGRSALQQAIDEGRLNLDPRELGLEVPESAPTSTPPEEAVKATPPFDSYEALSIVYGAVQEIKWLINAGLRDPAVRLFDALRQVTETRNLEPLRWWYEPTTDSPSPAEISERITYQISELYAKAVRKMERFTSGQTSSAPEPPVIGPGPGAGRTEARAAGSTTLTAGPPASPEQSDINQSLASRVASRRAAAPVLRTIDDLRPGRRLFLKINWDIKDEGGEQKVYQTARTVKSALDKFDEVYLCTHYQRPTRVELDTPEGHEKYNVGIHVLPVAKKAMAAEGIDADIVTLPEAFAEMPAAIEAARTQANGKRKIIFMLPNSRAHPAESSYYTGTQPTPDAQDALIRQYLETIKPDAYLNEAIESHETDASVRMANHFPLQARAAGSYFASVVNKVLAFEAQMRGAGLIVWGGAKPDKVHTFLPNYVSSDRSHAGDVMAVVGALAHPFLIHRGEAVGVFKLTKKPEVAAAVKEAVPAILTASQKRGIHLLLPSDHIVKGVAEPVTTIGDTQEELDIGPDTTGAMLTEVDQIIVRHHLFGDGWIIASGGTGIFEIDEGRVGTRRLLEKLEEAAKAGVPVLLVGGDMDKAARAVQEKDWGGRELHPAILRTTAGGTVLESLPTGIAGYGPVQALLKEPQPASPSGPDRGPTAPPSTPPAMAQGGATLSPNEYAEHQIERGDFEGALATLSSISEAAALPGDKETPQGREIRQRDLNRALYLMVVVRGELNRRDSSQLATSEATNAVPDPDQSGPRGEGGGPAIGAVLFIAGAAAVLLALAGPTLAAVSPHLSATPFVENLFPWLGAGLAAAPFVYLGIRQRGGPASKGRRSGDDKVLLDAIKTAQRDTSLLDPQKATERFIYLGSSKSRHPLHLPDEPGYKALMKIARWLVAKLRQLKGFSGTAGVSAGSWDVYLRLFATPRDFNNAAVHIVKLLTGSPEDVAARMKERGSEPPVKTMLTSPIEEHIHFSKLEFDPELDDIVFYPTVALDEQTVLPYRIGQPNAAREWMRNKIYDALQELVARTKGTSAEPIVRRILMENNGRAFHLRAAMNLPVRAARWTDRQGVAHIIVDAGYLRDLLHTPLHLQHVSSWLLGELLYHEVGHAPHQAGGFRAHVDEEVEQVLRDLVLNRIVAEQLLEPTFRRDPVGARGLWDGIDEFYRFIRPASPSGNYFGRDGFLGDLGRMADQGAGGQRIREKIRKFVVQRLHMPRPADYRRMMKFMPTSIVEGGEPVEKGLASVRAAIDVVVEMLRANTPAGYRKALELSQKIQTGILAGSYLDLSTDDATRAIETANTLTTAAQFGLKRYFKSPIELESNLRIWQATGFLPLVTNLERPSPVAPAASAAEPVAPAGAYQASAEQIRALKRVVGETFRDTIATMPHVFRMISTALHGFNPRDTELAKLWDSLEPFIQESDLAAAGSAVDHALEVIPDPELQQAVRDLYSRAVSVSLSKGIESETSGLSAKEIRTLLRSTAYFMDEGPSVTRPEVFQMVIAQLNGRDQELAGRLNPLAPNTQAADITSINEARSAIDHAITGIEPEERREATRDLFLYAVLGERHNGSLGEGGGPAIGAVLFIAGAAAAFLALAGTTWAANSASLPVPTFLGSLSPWLGGACAIAGMIVTKRQGARYRNATLNEYEETKLREAEEEDDTIKTVFVAMSRFSGRAKKYGTSVVLGSTGRATEQLTQLVRAKLLESERWRDAKITVFRNWPATHGGLAWRLTGLKAVKDGATRAELEKAVREVLQKRRGQIAREKRKNLENAFMWRGWWGGYTKALIVLATGAALLTLAGTTWAANSASLPVPAFMESLFPWLGAASLAAIPITLGIRQRGKAPTEEGPRTFSKLWPEDRERVLRIWRKTPIWFQLLTQVGPEFRELPDPELVQSCGTSSWFTMMESGGWRIKHVAYDGQAGMGDSLEIDWDGSHALSYGWHDLSTHHEDSPRSSSIIRRINNVHKSPLVWATVQDFERYGEPASSRYQDETVVFLQDDIYRKLRQELGGALRSRYGNTNRLILPASMRTRWEANRACARKLAADGQKLLQRAEELRGRYYYSKLLAGVVLATLLALSGTTWAANSASLPVPAFMESLFPWLGAGAFAGMIISKGRGAHRRNVELNQEEETRLREAEEDDGAINAAFDAMPRFIGLGDEYGAFVVLGNTEPATEELAELVRGKLLESKQWRSAEITVFRNWRASPTGLDWQITGLEVAKAGTNRAALEEAVREVLQKRRGQIAWKTRVMLEKAFRERGWSSGHTAGLFLLAAGATLLALSGTTWAAADPFVQQAGFHAGALLPLLISGGGLVGLVYFAGSIAVGIMMRPIRAGTAAPARKRLKLLQGWLSTSA